MKTNILPIIVILIGSILGILGVVVDSSFMLNEFEKCPKEDLKSCFQCCAKIDTPFEISEFSEAQCLEQCSIELLKR